MSDRGRDRIEAQDEVQRQLIRLKGGFVVLALILAHRRSATAFLVSAAYLAP